MKPPGEVLILDSVGNFSLSLKQYIPSFSYHHITAGLDGWRLLID